MSEKPASASPSPARIEEIREKCARALDMVSDLCTGKRDWIMSIPARPDHDPDLIIAAALGEISDLLSAYDALAAENERLREGLTWAVEAIDKHDRRSPPEERVCSHVHVRHLQRILSRQPKEQP